MPMRETAPEETETVERLRARVAALETESNSLKTHMQQIMQNYDLVRHKYHAQKNFSAQLLFEELPRVDASMRGLPDLTAPAHETRGPYTPRRAGADDGDEVSDGDDGDVAARPRRARFDNDGFTAADARGRVDGENGTAGGFVLGRVIGTGRFSTVILARESATGAQCAVKCVAKCDAGSPSKMRRLALEVRAGALLARAAAAAGADDERARAVVPVTQAFATQTRLMFVQQEVSQTDLFMFLQQRLVLRRDASKPAFPARPVAFFAHGPITAGEARLVLAQVADAVAHCHASGVLHRDVKPENLLVDEDAVAPAGTRAALRVRLCDFGSALLCEPRPEGAAGARVGPVLSRELIGSPGFVAPECLMLRSTNPDRPYDARPMDAWSMGCIALELALGPYWFRDHWLLSYQQFIEGIEAASAHQTAWMEDPNANDNTAQAFQAGVHGARAQREIVVGTFQDVIRGNLRTAYTAMQMFATPHPPPAAGAPPAQPPAMPPHCAQIHAFMRLALALAPEQRSRPSDLAATLREGATLPMAYPPMP